MLYCTAILVNSSFKKNFCLIELNDTRRHTLNLLRIFTSFNPVCFRPNLSRGSEPVMDVSQLKNRLEDRVGSDLYKIYGLNLFSACSGMLNFKMWRSCAAADASDFELRTFFSRNFVPKDVADEKVANTVSSKSVFYELGFLRRKFFLPSLRMSLRIAHELCQPRASSNRPISHFKEAASQAVAPGWEPGHFTSAP